MRELGKSPILYIQKLRQVIKYLGGSWIPLHVLLRAKLETSNLGNREEIEYCAERRPGSYAKSVVGKTKGGKYIQRNYLPLWFLENLKRIRIFSPQMREFNGIIHRLREGSKAFDSRYFVKYFLLLMIPSHPIP